MTRRILLKYVFLFLVFFYIAKFFYGNYPELQHVQITITPVYLLLSCLVLVIYYINLASLWYLVTGVADCRISFEQSVISWFYSQLGKYLPGKLFTVVGRIYFYKKNGISPEKVGVCFYIETLSALVGAILLCVFSARYLKIPFLKEYHVVTYLLLSIIFIMLHPKIIGRLINAGLSILNRPPIKLHIPYVQICLIVILYSFNHLILGIGFFCLVRSIYPLSMSYIFLISGAYALASILGFLSLFAPSGIGVREGVLIYTLKYILPYSIAGIIAILARFWIIIVELSLVFLVFCYAKIQRIAFLS